MKKKDISEHFKQELSEIKKEKQRIKAEKQKDRINRKLYFQQLKKTRKELKKAAKSYSCWDESFLFDFMDIIFDSWKNYYHLGYNVWAIERCECDKDDPFYQDAPTREEIANNFIRLRTEMDNCRFDDINECDIKTKAFFDYMATYIHYMWD